MMQKLRSLYCPSFSLVSLCLLPLFLLACSYSPVAKLQGSAKDLGFVEGQVLSDGFELSFFTSASLLSDFGVAIPGGQSKALLQTRSQTLAAGRSSTLHIYLEGDGIPWGLGYHPARNPTTQRPYALSLMSRDTAPSIYLNRPCYGIAVSAENCDSALWTSARYSEQVVEVISGALDTFRTRLGVERFVLIGYSGGGTIASLLAARREDVSVVITVAGNLDHSRWTQHFHYDPLSLSLNSLNVFPLPSSIKRWHLLAEKDEVLPFEITHSAAQRDLGATILRYPHYDHDCCWESIWAEFMGSLEVDID